MNSLSSGLALRAYDEKERKFAYYSRTVNLFILEMRCPQMDVVRFEKSSGNRIAFASEEEIDAAMKSALAAFEESWGARSSDDSGSDCRDNNNNNRWRCMALHADEHTSEEAESRHTHFTHSTVFSPYFLESQRHLLHSAFMGLVRRDAYWNERFFPTLYNAVLYHMLCKHTARPLADFDDNLKHFAKGPPPLKIE